MTTFRPITPDAVQGLIVERIPSGIARVAIDGPPSSRPHDFADSVVDRLRGARPAAHVHAETFWRDASLRLEFGRADVTSYLSWLDSDALRREVLDPIAARGEYLTSLRDPVTNRSTRAAPQPVEPNTALVVSGSLLLGLGLPFDLTVHLAVSPAARARQVIADEAWTLPAYEQYDAEAQPIESADIVIRYDDPRHPAIRVRG